MRTNINNIIINNNNNIVITTYHLCCHIFSSFGIHQCHQTNAMMTSSKANWHSFHRLLLLLHVFHPQRQMEESIKVGCCFFCVFCLCFGFALFACHGFCCFSFNFTLFSLFLLLCLFHPPVDGGINRGCCFCMCCLCLGFVSFDSCVFGCFSHNFILFSLFLLLHLFRPPHGWRNQ